MNADIYFINPETKEETFLGNYDVTSPEEEKQKEDFIDFLKSVGADLDYMREQGHID